jgi:hypothetical protein
MREGAALSEDDTHRSRWRRTAPWLLGFVTVLFVAVVGGLVALRMDARARVLEAQRAVAASRAAAYTSLPATPANASALRLETLAAAAGIELVPRSVTRASAAPVAAIQLPGRRAELVRAAARGIPMAPPKELTDWIATTDAAMTAIEAHLVAEAPPEWEEVPAKGNAAPIPNLSGHLKLAQMMLARASLAAEPEAAERSLLASWNLATSLGRRHETICQLIRLSELRLHADVATGSPVSPADWERRYSALDVEPTLRAALDWELAVLVETATNPQAARAAYGASSSSSSGGQLAAMAFGAIAPVVMARTVEASHARLAALDAAGPCGDAESIGSQAFTMQPWAMDFGFGLPLSAVARARFTQLELEMTRRILAMKAAREAGRLPPGADVAAVIGPPRLACADIRFEETVLPDGRLRLVVSGVPWTSPSGTPPGVARPLAWEEPAP